MPTEVREKKERARAFRPLHARGGSSSEEARTRILCRGRTTKSPKKGEKRTEAWIAVIARERGGTRHQNQSYIINEELKPRREGCMSCTARGRLGVKESDRLTDRPSFLSTREWKPSHTKGSVVERKELGGLTRHPLLSKAHRRGEKSVYSKKALKGRIKQTRKAVLCNNAMQAQEEPCREKGPWFSHTAEANEGGRWPSGGIRELGGERRTVQSEGRSHYSGYRHKASRR